MLVVGRTLTRCLSDLAMMCATCLPSRPQSQHLFDVASMTRFLIDAGTYAEDKQAGRLFRFFGGAYSFSPLSSTSLSRETPASSSDGTASSSSNAPCASSSPLWVRSRNSSISSQVRRNICNSWKKGYVVGGWAEVEPESG